ncbi:MAG: hypothetical protein MRJ68_11960 [Nitrospira sp.]|nr:hypothetical protein [Nitrospira sp.]
MTRKPAMNGSEFLGIRLLSKDLLRYDYDEDRHDQKRMNQVFVILDQVKKFFRRNVGNKTANKE